ncbi:hypothetical protein [Pantoea stewartii]|uniref:hypothetical protein n=1 Tax=Pantoea stewartii TaxID=66269 RepID=UPI0025A0E1C6|nr:hypothetical protein [Pantoea stewartii]
MAKFKSLIIGAQVEVASRKTSCKHNKEHIISNGEFRLKVKNSTQGQSYYCINCGNDMIVQSKKKLEELEQQIKMLNNSSCS